MACIAQKKLHGVELHDNERHVQKFVRQPACNPVHTTALPIERGDDDDDDGEDDAGGEDNEDEDKDGDGGVDVVGVTIDDVGDGGDEDFAGVQLVAQERGAIHENLPDLPLHLPVDIQVSLSSSSCCDDECHAPSCPCFMLYAPED